MLTPLVAYGQDVFVQDFAPVPYDGNGYPMTASPGLQMVSGATTLTSANTAYQLVTPSTSFTSCGGTSGGNVVTVNAGATASMVGQQINIVTMGIYTFFAVNSATSITVNAGVGFSLTFSGKAGWIVTPCKQIVISPDAGVAGLVIIGGPNITSTTPYNGLQVACSTTVPAPPITLPIADAGAVWALGVAASHVIGYVYSL